MSKQTWVEALAWAVSDGTAVANTTSETIIFPNIIIPANYLQDGRTLRVKVFGKYSTTGTPTMIFGARWGGVAGTLLCKTAACTTQSGVTNGGFQLEFDIQVRTNGATGTVMANGVARVFNNVAGTVGSATGMSLVTAMMNGGVITPAVATIDATADTALAITLIWSAASASNTATGLQYTIEALN